MQEKSETFWGVCTSVVEVTGEWRWRWCWCWRQYWKDDGLTSQWRRSAKTCSGSETERCKSNDVSLSYFSVQLMFMYHWINCMCGWGTDFILMHFISAYKMYELDIWLIGRALLEVYDHANAMSCNDSSSCTWNLLSTYHFCSEVTLYFCRLAVFTVVLAHCCHHFRALLLLLLLCVGKN